MGIFSTDRTQQVVTRRSLDDVKRLVRAESEDHKRYLPGKVRSSAKLGLTKIKSFAPESGSEDVYDLDDERPLFKVGVGQFSKMGGAEVVPWSLQIHVFDAGPGELIVHLRKQSDRLSARIPDKLADNIARALAK